MLTLELTLIFTPKYQYYHVHSAWESLKGKLVNAPRHKDLLGILNEKRMALVNLKPWGVNWVTWFYDAFIFYKNQGKNLMY